METTCIGSVQHGDWRIDVIDRGENAAPRFDCQAWHCVPDMGFVHAGYGRYVNTFDEAMAYASGFTLAMS